LPDCGRAPTAAERAQQRLDVVWTSQETGTGAGRLTPALVIDLIGTKRRAILLVTYTTNTRLQLLPRWLRQLIVTSRSACWPSHTTTCVIPSSGHRSSDFAVRMRWPAGRRPPGAALHAKIVVVVVDDVALVVSANFTGCAISSNLECGC